MLKQSHFHGPGLIIFELAYRNTHTDRPTDPHSYSTVVIGIKIAFFSLRR